MLEFYLDTYEGYGGEGQLISKFGIEVKNRLTFTVSVKRFQEEVKENRPHEGDLIWFPLTNSFFEILYVEDNVPFFELGKNYTYKLSTQTWYYGQETIQTNETILNNFVETRKERLDLLANNDEFNDFGNDKIVDSNIFGIKVKKQ